MEEREKWKTKNYSGPYFFVNKCASVYKEWSWSWKLLWTTRKSTKQ